MKACAEAPSGSRAVSWQLRNIQLERQKEQKSVAQDMQQYFTQRQQFVPARHRQYNPLLFVPVDGGLQVLTLKKLPNVSKREPFGQGLTDQEMRKLRAVNKYGNYMQEIYATNSPLRVMQRSESAISKKNKAKLYTTLERSKAIADSNGVTETMRSTRDVFCSRRYASASANRQFQ